MLGQLGGLQLPQDGKAVHVRHDNVQKDQGEAAVLGGQEALLGGVADRYVVVIPEDGAQKFGLNGAVVDH